MEACASAHHWGRDPQKRGFRVKLIAAQFVKPYVKSNKNDRVDAEAICEAMSRPGMRFVAVKSISQQDTQAAHRIREAQDDEPDAVKQVLDCIGHLYQTESRIRDAQLVGEQKRSFRLTHSKPMVDQLFAWFDQQRQRPELIPSNPLSKAIAYMQNREQELRVFLEDPAVPMDNNHTERALRVVPLGRKNWMFCWTELG